MKWSGVNLDECLIAVRACSRPIALTCDPKKLVKDTIGQKQNFISVYKSLGQFIQCIETLSMCIVHSGMDAFPSAPSATSTSCFPRHTTWHTTAAQHHACVWRGGGGRRGTSSVSFCRRMRLAHAPALPGRPRKPSIGSPVCEASHSPGCQPGAPQGVGLLVCCALLCFPFLFSFLFLSSSHWAVYPQH